MNRDTTLAHLSHPGGGDTAAAARAEQTLLDRARQLAGSPADPGLYESSTPILVFRYGPSRYGLPLSDIAEVITGVNPAKVPGAPAEVAGLVQLRGEICPVFHLSGLLSASHSTRVENARTVLLVRTGTRTVGILVEQAEEMRVIPEKMRRPPPEGAPHIHWTTDDLVAVLNPLALMDKEERWRI
jgi:chemotaxis signal transduction protein